MTGLISTDDVETEDLAETQPGILCDKNGLFRKIDLFITTARDAHKHISKIS